MLHAPPPVPVLTSIRATATATRRVDGRDDVRALFGHLVRNAVEMACIAYLDADRAVRFARHIRGDRGSVRVSPRVIVIDALLHDARAVIVAHNHPSGDPRPSAADLAHARTIARALDTIDVRLLDSLILAGDDITSFVALGLL